MRILSYNCFVFVICIFFLGQAVPAHAEISLSIGGGYLAGETQYQIGGTIKEASGTTEVHFPLSELNFPLDAFMLKGQVEATFKERWGLMLSAATNITEDTGDMRDSDWIISPSSLDIYSESDTEMDALLLEGKLSYIFYEGYYGQGAVNEQGVNSDLIFAYSVGLGYKYQDFEFDIYDLDQWYPSLPDEPHDIVPGRVLAYEAEYQIPYLELAMIMKARDKYRFELSLGYAPVINFEDKDQHLLRDLVAVADHDWDGNAKFVKLMGRYNLSQRWYLQADFEAMQIESEGRSETYVGGAWDHTIDHEVESHQYSSYLTLGCSF